MTTINKDIITKAAIAISNFIKNIDANIKAGDHPILLVDGVQVSVEIKLNSETQSERDTYVAIGRVADISVNKLIGFKTPTQNNRETEQRPTAERMATKISKVLLDHAVHGEHVFYELQCAINNPKEDEVFTATLATGHVVTVEKGVCKIADMKGEHLTDIVLAHYSASFGLAMAQVNRAIYGDMTVASFVPFKLIGNV